MNDFDGKIVIGTKIDTKQFDKDYNKLSKELEDLDRKANDIAKLDNPTDEQLTEYEKIVEKIGEIREQQEEINQKKKEELKIQQEINASQQKQPSTGKGASAEELEDAKKIEELSIELQNAYTNYENITKRNKENKIVSEEDLKYAENLKEKVKEIAEEYEKVTGSKLYIKGINDIQQENKKASASFKNLNGKIIRLGLSLFSIQSAYALVSKASSAYLSQDTELAQKLQSVWVGLGSFLAPMLEGISNSLLKALGYLNVFIKALTGIDYIARANAKALDKQANSQKNLNKQLLAGIDEVTNLQDESSGSSGGSVSSLIDIPELDDRIIKKLQDLAYWLKVNWGWIKKVGEILLFVFAVKKLTKVLSGIKFLTDGASKIADAFGKVPTKIKGVKSSLNGLPTSVKIGITLAGVAVIAAEIKAIKEDIASLNSQLNYALDHAEEIYNKLYGGEKTTSELLKDQKGRREAINETYKKSKGFLKKITGLSERELKNIQLNLKSQGKILEKLDEQYGKEQLNEDQKKKILNNLIEQYNYAQKMSGVLEANGINTKDIKESTTKYGEEIKKVAKDLGISQTKLNEMIISSSNEEDITKGIYDNIKDINNVDLTNKDATYTITYDVATKEAEKKSRSFWDKFFGFSPSTDGHGGWFSSLRKLLAGGGRRGGAFADGGILPAVPLQGIVYNPGPGVNIGGGNIAGEEGAEVVFPLQNSKFIDAFAGQLAQKMDGGNSEAIMQLLLELNRNIVNLSDRPVVLNINGKSFAQATYTDYKNEQKRQNDNTQIIRS